MPKEQPKIGVFICHCGSNIAGVIDIPTLREYAATLPNVVVAEDYRYMCSDPGQDLIKERAREKGLNRVVVAACSPTLHEPTFQRVLVSAGLNPFFFDMSNIREHCSWVHTHEEEAALEKAKDLIKMAVARAAELEPLEQKEVDVKANVLVVGAGIAGIQAALDIADAGYKVYLVEKQPSIGGHMAQLDKTFPTLDCSSCILTPKMSLVGQHPNIELLTYSEVREVEGYVGNFKVKIEKKPRYVIEDKCTACADCLEVCPVNVPDEFNSGLGWRKAIHIPFAQAVPNAYVIDTEHCLGMTPIACGKCKDSCEAEAIDYEMKSEILELDIGAIIVTTGFELFDAMEQLEYGYGKYPDVMTNLEMERMLSAAGPTEGKILRPSSMKKPKHIAYIQCVGSRNERYNAYCSRVCCMAALKQARQIREKYPDIQVTIFYIDMRAFGKGYEEFYETTAREHGVTFVRGRVSEVRESYDSDHIVVRAEDTFLAQPVEAEVDIVVLSCGIQAPKDQAELARVLGIQRSADGFFLEAHPKLRPVETNTDGIFIAGAAQGPKDIPDSVAQAKGAAASALSMITAGRVLVQPYAAVVNEDLCAGCGICEASCPYGAVKVVDNRAQVTEAQCKGCGTCAAACPNQAIAPQHFTMEQIIAQLDALFQEAK
ncbi:MAG: 4Fe-4S binding protein [Candidatus Thorarchaeota archaeon]